MCGTTAGAPVVRFTVDGSAARALAWSPTGQLASAHHDGIVRVWNVAAGKEVARFARPTAAQTPNPTWLAWSPDGTRITAAGDDSVVRIRIVTEECESFTLAGRVGAVSVPRNPDRRRLATSDLKSGDRNRTGIRVWDAQSGKQLLHVPGEFGAATWGANGWRL